MLVDYGSQVDWHIVAAMSHKGNAYKNGLFLVQGLLDLLVGTWVVVYSTCPSKSTQGLLCTKQSLKKMHKNGIKTLPPGHIYKRTEQSSKLLLLVVMLVLLCDFERLTSRQIVNALHAVLDNGSRGCKFQHASNIGQTRL